jgi:putative protein-disulfide isomerase
MSRKLHYLYDPLCGWCYGASRLVDAAAGVEGLEFVMHGGGLWPQPTRLPDDMRRYIRDADARVGAMNGVPYGEPYLNGLLFDPELVLESRPTIAAVLAADACEPGKGLAMLHAIQAAHYVEGRHVVQPSVLDQLATRIGLEPGAFAAALAAAPVDAHIAESRRLMATVGAAGFPTFVLELDGRYLGAPHNRFAGNPDGFAAWLAGAGPAAVSA